MAQVAPARRVAFRILLAVERGHVHADELLRAPAVGVLSPADRNLATTLVLGVLRWQIRLDHQFRALLRRPSVTIEPEVCVALRLGAFQLLHLNRIPAHAAIGESVELVKLSGHRFAAGMVNAVLRKLAARPVQSWERSVSGLALGWAHPAWMVERWIHFYGFEAAEAICRHGQKAPDLSLRLASSQVESELGAAGIALAPGELLAAARRLVSGDLAAAEAFRAGRARLQDEGSQLVAELASAGGGTELKSVLDACAAPGGKTMILAERHPEARIVALEASASRREELRKRLAFLSDRVECRLGDASAPTPEAAYDLILVDAPCSGTGTLGRNPEIRHRLRPEHLNRQSSRQRAILEAALSAVRPGGNLVYSTCSLEPEENEQVVAAALAAHPQNRLVSLGARIEALRKADILTSAGAARLADVLTPEGCLRLLPGKFATDGFFIALIEHSG
ncbi:MAG: transcription antitermination factor NusB [Terracidiphilus sp.]